MDINVSIGNESLTIKVENPHRFNVSRVIGSIVDFGLKFGIDLAGLKIERLIPRMIRGVAGCEGGCPADAKNLVRQGFGDFRLSYIEGGILSAVCTLENGKPLNLKIFPEFD
jgi:hypothetical protein